MRLALELGYPNVDLMLMSMSARQFAEWEAFDKISPIGGIRGDYQAALVASVIANANRDPKKKSKPFSVHDFLLKFSSESERRKTRSIDEMRNNALLWHQLFSGTGKMRGT